MARVKGGSDADGQSVIEGTQEEKIPEIHSRALMVRRLRDEVGALQGKLKDKDAALVDAMKANLKKLSKITKGGVEVAVYRFGTVSVEFIHSDKCRVRVNGQPAATSDEQDGNGAEHSDAKDD